MEMKAALKTHTI